MDFVPDPQPWGDARFWPPGAPRAASACRP